MSSRALAPASVPKTYAELREAVEATLLEGQRAIEHAKLLTYHETGRLINAHVLVNSARADYGARVLLNLSQDLHIARTTLYQCCQFAEYFPIVRARGQLTWAYYRTLCQVADADERNALLEQTVKNAWTSGELEARVRTFNAMPVTALEPGGRAASTKLDLLQPKCGAPGLHLIVAKSIGLVVDLGFKHYWRLPAGSPQAKRLAAGDIVRIARDDSLRVAEGATKADLFTYAAELIRVIDGDTLLVALEVAPEVFIEQKLRLRGLDCPELSTPDGKAAKRFVEALLATNSVITINTTRADKYDRYLADVFLAPADGKDGAGPDGIFLNNALLENGHAVRKDAWEFGDWEPALR